ncbi:MAG TPA: DNA-processing protein DprA [Ktedonobacteraceae bacterium]
MKEKLQEQVYWLLLAFESGLPKHVVNDIILTWYQQSGHTLQEFFSAEPDAWRNTCQLDASMIAKLEKVRTKNSDNYSKQLTLLEELAQDQIHMLTLLDDNYPSSLNALLPADQRPPVLFYCGDLEILNFPTIAIIGSRHANEESLLFTREVAQCLTEQGANVISGYARGVDQAAFKGATSSSGNTTVVLPQGIRRLTRNHLQKLQAKIETGNVLLMSQFHPDASWTVGRAMERNFVVTGLAQVVVVAESSLQGGTWAGANGALQQQRMVYVRQGNPPASLPGNQALIERGGCPLVWSPGAYTDGIPLLEDSMNLLLAEGNIKVAEKWASTRGTATANLP